MARDPMAVRGRANSEHVFVDYSSGEPGPCLVILAGLHGDEKGGVKALERVARWLDETRTPVRGRVLGVLGNLAALEANKRYVDRDLNRGWYEEEIARLRAQERRVDCVEDREALDLIDLIDTLDDETCRPVVFLDLHSTSADGKPFVCMPDTLTNLRIALELPIPSILGLEETIDGPLLGLMSDRGYRGVIVEGGRHDREQTAGALESSTWILLVALGILSKKSAPHFDRHRARLAALGAALPRVLEIVYRHDTSATRAFEMLPGFEHYDRVRSGQRLARDAEGDVVSPRNGRILMPAYSPGTDQGFFVARDLRPVFVRFLFLLRRMRLDRACHLLPGAKREPGNPDRLLVSPWVPRWMVNTIRLLGWRPIRFDADRLVLRRRRVRG